MKSRVVWCALVVLCMFGLLAWAAPWTEVAPLNVARSKHRAVVLDGKIYVVGGTDKDGKCAPVEVYDPTTNTWTVLGPSPVNCEMPCLAAVGGKIYSFAGRTLARVRTLAGYVWDPSSGVVSWLPVPAGMTWAHGDAACVVIGTKIYLLSGEDDSLTNIGFDYVEAVDVFDVATGKWSTAAPLTKRGREDFDATAVGTKIVMVGGQGGPDQAALRWLSVYDAETNTWQHWDEGVPIPWEHPRTVTVGEYVYVMTGRGEGAFVNYRLDLATMSWSEHTPPPEPILQGAAVVLGGKIYLIGGVHLDGTLLARVFVYDPGADR